MKRLRQGRRQFVLITSTLMLSSLLISIGGFEPVARAQEANVRISKKSSAIRDKAGLFAADTIAKANMELERIERGSGVTIIIETIETLKGEPADKVAIQLAQLSGTHGVFVLISRKERKLEVLVSRQYREGVTEARRKAIREAFFEGFHRQDFNGGLKQGVAAIGDALSGFHREEPAARSTIVEALTWSGTKAESPLVVRNRVGLTIAGARVILAGGVAKAQAIGIKANIAVVDEGGHLIAFERMDGARPSSVYTSMTKATTAATMRQPSGPLPPGATSPDPLLNLSLEHAATASGGKVTTLLGGIPILVEGQVIGGVGVGGGTGEQDAQVARAGVQAFDDQLAKLKPPPPTNPAKSDPPKAIQPEQAASKKTDGDF